MNNLATDNRKVTKSFHFHFFNFVKLLSLTLISYLRHNCDIFSSIFCNIMTQIQLVAQCFLLLMLQTIKKLSSKRGTWQNHIIALKQQEYISGYLHLSRYFLLPKYKILRQFLWRGPASLTHKWFHILPIFSPANVSRIPGFATLLDHQTKP